MNQTKMIGGGLFIIGLISLTKAGRSDKQFNIIRDVGAIALFSGGIIYWCGIVGSSENPSFLIFG